MGNTITYTRTGILGINEIKQHTVELGSRNVEREGSCEDMVISRIIARDCPIKVCMLLRTTGSLDVWYVEFSNTTNPYWHFDHNSNDSSKTRKPTEAQVAAITRLKNNDSIYADLGGFIGKDILDWAYGKYEAELAREYNN